MPITTQSYKRCEILRVTGRIDSSNANILYDAFKVIQDKGKFNIVFDMAGITFISSRGWWVLIETQKVCKRYNRGKLVLVDVDEKILSSLELVGMKDYFIVYEDLVDAVGNF